jgi:hypothetical protein
VPAFGSTGTTRPSTGESSQNRLKSPANGRWHANCSVSVVQHFSSVRCAGTLSLALAACSSSHQPGGGGDPSPGGARTPGSVANPGKDGSGSSTPSVLEPGQVRLADVPAGTAEDLQRFDELSAEIASLDGVSAEQLLADYAVQHVGALGYSPRSAEFMDRIAASALSLNEAELSRLEQNGFVVSARQQFPTFLRGYAAIHMEHLPVFVSADALLDAVHRSYDSMLSEFETFILIEDLREMLSLMQARIAGLDASDTTKDDLALYLQVASGLLSPATLSSANREARALVDVVRAGSGIREVELFGVSRLEDFSQFTPRGHYTEEPLSDYFRAMMWLGRVDFRLIETLSDGSVVFRRAQFDAVLALERLLEGRPAELWQNIDTVVRSFVGESDSMTVPEIARLVEDLGGLDAARAASDADVAQAIVLGNYGHQQIASHLMVNDTVQTLPLNRSFLLFGQRYTADSHVFSQTVYDRVRERLMPSALDAAFAALGNDQALALDADELGRFSDLPAALGGMRLLIDAHDASFWNANLYNLWSSSLRALSPVADLREPASAGLPRVAGTEAWGRRLLNAQLGSWSQLRHDTLLYAKQSYTGIPSCEFPDAYVEPYPEFFQALVRFAERGAELVDIGQRNEYLGPRLQKYFDTLRSTAALLGQIAEQQRSGMSPTPAQLDFINDAVRVELQDGGCTTIETPDGWYADLFYDPAKSIELEPTISDVHTQPADEFGNIVGKVLHVGTGLPRLMTMTVDTCVGPRAYVGLAYAYHEKVTDDFERLTDEAWAAELMSTPPADVGWAAPFIAE